MDISVTVRIFYVGIGKRGHTLTLLRIDVALAYVVSIRMNIRSDQPCLFFSHMR